LLLAGLTAGFALVAPTFRLGGAPARSPSQSPRRAILVDDFAPQLPGGCRENPTYLPVVLANAPPSGSAFPALSWHLNRLGGDRGVLGAPWGVVFGRGVVTATIAGHAEATYAGVWTSLNHLRNENLAIDFSAIYPPQFLQAYQLRITGVRVTIAKSRGQGRFNLELQAPDNRFVWRGQKDLNGDRQVLQFELSTALGAVRNLNWFIEGRAGDFVAVEKVELMASRPAGQPAAEGDGAREAFVQSYAMLLANWSSGTGLTRDRADVPAGEFDNVSASGLQAAAAVVAWRLGVIGEGAARDIVAKTTGGLLALPRHFGLWPHFVRHGRIVADSEWSSIDTVIALIALIEARHSLGLDTSEAERRLKEIDWRALRLPDGSLSHGFTTKTDGCSRLRAAGATTDFAACSVRMEEDNNWRDFGTESWLVNFGHAVATGEAAAFTPEPPTANGAGFIDELAWLLLPAPVVDRWRTHWHGYRRCAAETQVEYYKADACYGGPPRLFGLSAAEVPDPARAAPGRIYHAFGVGGGRDPAADGSDLFCLGHPVIVPHYAAMSASLRPEQAKAMWAWMVDRGIFTALNNVESLMIADEPGDQRCGRVVWNSLKGSWNLGLQALGWGRLLVGDDHPLYRAARANAPLRGGMEVMRGADVCAAVDTGPPFSSSPDPPTLSRRYAGPNLCGWEVVVGDGVFVAPDERDVGMCDVDTIPSIGHSELLANLKRRRVQARNITFKRIEDPGATGFVHVCRYHFRMPFQPDPVGAENGETVEGHLAVWDGSGVRRDFTAGWQWVVNPAIPVTATPQTGALRIWQAQARGGPGRWHQVGDIPPDDDWHVVQLLLDVAAGTAEFTIDGTIGPFRASEMAADEKPDKWGSEIAARCAVAIVSQNPGGRESGSLHRLFVRDWEWKWTPRRIHLPLLRDDRIAFHRIME